MTLGEHIRELRNRLVWALLAIVAVTVVAWFFYDPPLLQILTKPFCEVQRLNGVAPVGQPREVGGTPGCPLYFNSIFQPFLLRLKVSAIIALVVASPVWFHQLWAFVTPGLRRSERKWGAAFLAIAVPLFVGGAVLAYFVLDKGLTLLLKFIPTEFGALITIDHYFKYATALMLVFGVGFELPLLITMLNLAGVLTYERLKLWQRKAVMLIFVFAMIVTPQDPFSMIMLAIPMVLLFELSVVLAYVNDKRRGRNQVEAAYDDLDDDETSPLEMDRTEA
ncbi:MAG: twin-arginine translocase subunit TatC [Streptosporangiales bacterium]|nr:twin-arginine translocase subunit TatC [Streptosporangiales bacterium]